MARWFMYTEKGAFMNEIVIALLQLLPGDNVEENLKIGIEACRKAKSLGADIALFPEMWSCGYEIPDDPNALRKMAAAADGDFVKTFGRLAAELNMAIGITFLEQFDPLPRNSLCVFDRYGRRVLSYAKVHTCDFGDEKRLYPGSEFSVSELDTEKGTIRIGAMICYDREFPESARILMLKGAELLLVPNACPMEINRLCQLRARAFENMVAVATVNYPSPKPDCNGHSSVYDGVAYLPDLAGSRDMCILEAGEESDIYLANLDLQQLRKYRKQEVHGNAYRRPWFYHLLTKEIVEEPFVRNDNRKIKTSFYKDADNN